MSGMILENCILRCKVSRLVMVSFAIKVHVAENEDKLSFLVTNGFWIVNLGILGDSWIKDLKVRFL